MNPDSPTFSKSHYIPGIDGIRTIAVLSVMVFHFGLPVHGGFIGVDIFFVISGFLITSLLIRDYFDNGHISLARFWVRRMRRLIPGMAVMVIAVVIAAIFLSSLTVRLNLRGDLISTLAYFANWHFINNSSYFASDGTVSPLLHMWSLAVEEQFYILWPLFIALIFQAMKRRVNGLFWISLCVVAGSALSMAALWVNQATERAYMGTDTRVFQLAMGAALATFITLKTKCVGSPSVRSIFATGGLVILVICFFALGNESGPINFYAHGGAFVVGLATVGLLWATASGSHLLTPVLSNTPMTYLGRLSYGMYLWHWPLFIFGVVLLPSGYPLAELVNAIVLSVLTIILAGLSYHFIELPLRTRGPLVSWPQWRVLIAIPMSLLIIGVVSQQALSRVTSEKIVMLVGDSVPARLAEKFDNYASKKGWHVINAAKGSCPALGVWIADPSGKDFGRGKTCRDEIRRQQIKTLNDYHPSVVIWWSRYEIADRFDKNGDHLSPSQSRFWQLQKNDLSAQVETFTADGAQLVFVPIEPTGIGIKSRCTSEKCHWFLRRLISPEGISFQKKWNEILKDATTINPNTHYLDITKNVCRNNAIPCNDLIDGTSARSDGTHYVGKGISKVVPTIIDFGIKVSDSQKP